MRISDWSSDVCSSDLASTAVRAEQLQRARAGQFGGGRVIILAPVRIEAVSGFVKIDAGERRIGVDHLLHLGYRDAGIVTAEMQDHRYARRFVELLGHQSAVIDRKSGG